MNLCLVAESPLPGYTHEVVLPVKILPIPASSEGPLVDPVEAMNTYWYAVTEVMKAAKKCPTFNKWIYFESLYY